MLARVGMITIKLMSSIRPNRDTVAVAMSGGVDSTAAAYLLKSQGHSVIGFHMVLHDRDDDSAESARTVAQQLGVELSIVDMREDFERLVVAPFVRAYTSGRTPSPCPSCNRDIKMNLLWKRARESGCNRIATGHYAVVDRTPAGPRIRKSSDPSKDQSYFLFELTSKMLENVLFPLGSMTKRQVRALVEEAGISVAGREESQELCFIGSGDYRTFLAERGVAMVPGPIRHVSGEVLGRHDGVWNFTVGQRRGLGIPAGEPLYVVRIEPDTHTIVVGYRQESESRTVRIGRINIQAPELPREGDRFEIKVRSTSKPVPCRLVEYDDDAAEFELDRAQSGIAPGQAAVFYRRDTLIGGGWIDEPRTTNPVEHSGFEDTKKESR